MKKMMFVMFAFLIASAAFLGACAPEQAPVAPAPAPAAEQPAAQPEVAESSPAAGLSGKLEFMTGTGIDSDLYKVYQELTAEFVAANPGVEIELVPSSTDHEGEIKTRLASGNIPDIWMTHGWSVGRYGSFLLPLENEAWAKDLNPALEPVMVSKDGHLYAFPIDLDIAGILYNADVLAEAGVSVESIKTWDDFMAACDAVKATGKTPIYNAGKDRWPTGLYVDWIAPGAMTDDTYNQLLAGTFMPDEYGKSLEMVAMFRDAGYFNPDYSSATTEDISLALAQGQTGFSFLMNFVAVSAYGYNPDAKVGFMPIPAFEGGQPYFISGEKNALGIWKDGKNVEVAKAYIAFLAQPENLLKLATSTGSAAGLTTVTVDLGGLSESFELTKTTPSVPYFDRVYMPNGSWDSIVATTEGVLTGQMTYEESIAKITEDFNSLYAQQAEK
jgi:raffinose/stachyose/melibiose transport system substrate-binding protein